jgi:uncharacterized protein YbaR (Trm112 family)
MIKNSQLSLVLIIAAVLSCSGQIEPVPAQIQREFTTDFSKQALSFEEVFSGGPPKDGIPALLDPPFVSVNEVQENLLGKDPVIVVSLQGSHMILPLRILTWHEIVNTSLAGIPIAVTYCPLCNTSLVFDRRHSEEVLDFGTTGRLHGSNLLMYDRQSESWWQQATGEAVFGKYTGNSLRVIPSRFLSWSSASRAFPQALVLSENTGFTRNYGENPYEGYDSPGNTPYLYSGEFREGSDPVSRVLILGVQKLVRVPYAEVMAKNVLEITVENQPLVILADKETGSPLDTYLFQDAKVNGTVNAYSAVVKGSVLRFYWDGESIRDRETQSLWEPSGLAVQGPLEGQSLEVINGRQSLDFSAFHFYQEAADPSL